MRRTSSVLVICMLLGACAGDVAGIRPSSSGFAGGSVLHPLEDGKRQLAAGRHGLAIRRFGEALARQPRSLEALNGIAVAYARLGRHDVAHTYFDRALELDARDAATLNNYGRSLLDQGRLREARPFLEQALRYASESEVPVIAVNMLRIRDAAPPPVLTALRDQEETEAGPRIVRVAADRYRLRTTIVPAAGPPKTIVERKIATSPIGEPALASLPEPQPDRAEDGRSVVARPADPPLPRMKPVWLRPVNRSERSELAQAARPGPASPDELVTIRTVIERRITGTGFDEVLDDIFAAPETGDAPFPIEHGVWT